MALQVTLKKGTLHFEGKIISTTAKSFTNYIDYYVENFKKLIINIEEVKEIDNDGIQVITAVWQKALHRKINFSIIGFGCKDIYDHFETILIA